ncbi:hypothetical protein CRG98_001572 [Punica granatum]|uniref:RNase H type-1 domain-containing protein n=1 Tax=Punica granatum TaxID=22663 RepID=A0A2I0LB98_PUNGR|nr:hypothetical protein CRG98_001572 [Punica granatum]
MSLFNSLDRTAIQTGNQICMLGSKWSAGDGSKINSWKDCWVGYTPLRSMLHGPLSRSDINLKVKDILNNDGTWNFYQLKVRREGRGQVVSFGIAKVFGFLTGHFARIRMKHIYREPNSVADFMARLSRDGVDTAQEFVLFDEPPSGVLELLFADLIGAASTRSICINTHMGTDIG